MCEKMTWTDYKQLKGYRKDVATFVYGRVEVLKNIEAQMHMAAAFQNYEGFKKLADKYEELTGGKEAHMKKVLDIFDSFKHMSITAQPANVPDFSKPTQREIIQHGRNMVS